MNTYENEHIIEMKEIRYMTPRERYIETLTFGSPDRIPLQVGGGRKSTREVWHSQGLPESVSPNEIQGFAYEQMGGKLDLPDQEKTFHVDERMIPMFEEKIIEERATSRIVQDWKGNICEISNAFTPEYLRNAIDFVTRRWIKCPVINRKDWESVQTRYNPSDPGHLPDSPAELGKALESRKNPSILHFSGPFWQLREWLGFEELCVLFYDDPKWVMEMIQFWKDYILQLMERAFQYHIPDEVHISEDMAYKKFAMISPEMTREFLYPVWQEWGDFIRSKNIPLYGMDSDGFVGELIPFWVEAGFTHCDPMEVAAGNDLPALRERWGKQIAFRGGIDKREMARGGENLKREIERLKPVIHGGGYIPGCDHGIPPDVSWENYQETVRLVARECGWL
jgi:hypothetical protein